MKTVQVVVAGRKHRGRWDQDGNTLRVSSPYGLAQATVGPQEPRNVAKELLTRLVTADVVVQQRPA